MKNVVLSLLLVVTLSLVFGAQEAFAVVPNCTVDDGTIEKLTGDQMYIATTTGQLAKLQIGGLPMTDKGKFCIVGDFKVGGIGSNKLCTDVSLDPSSGSPSVDWPMYCITFNSDSRLYSVDRKTGDLTKIGPNDGRLLINCDVNKLVNTLNTFEIDTGGLAYAGGFMGRWFQLDLTTGCLQILKDFLVDKDDTGSPTRLKLSGDGAYELVSATMFVTASDCDVLHNPLSAHTVAANGHVDTGALGCGPNEDGLYNINLATNVVTFISTTGLVDTFAMDMRAFDGNLCQVSKGGTLSEQQQDGTIIGTTATSNLIGGGLLFANGGTALQQLVGGILVEINKFNLLIDLIFS